MNSRTLLGLTVVLAIFSVSAHAQAAAEAALANAHSSASTVKAGSVLGRALNQGSGQLAGRIQQVAPSTASHRSQASGQLAAQANSGAPSTATPTGTSLIVAVHGGEPPACLPSNPRVQDQNSRVSTTPNCGSRSSSKAKPQTQYKSSVTLAFPQR